MDWPGLGHMPTSRSGVQEGDHPPSKQTDKEGGMDDFPKEKQMNVILRKYNGIWANQTV